MKTITRLARCVPPVLCGLILLSGGGCATQAMKGTPFFTGEWEEREGLVQDRIMMWPFLYYRDPALSVLWPVYEQTPDHIAVRPFYSVRGRESDQRVHSVLWPLGKFDPAKNSYRFFPFYWGAGDFMAFPLYWHIDEPFGKGGTSSFFPLWLYTRRDPEHHILHLGWPLTRFERSPAVNRSRVFPVYSSIRREDGSRELFALLYGHARSPAGDIENQWMLPLFLRKNAENETYFYSLPWSRREEEGRLARYVMAGVWGRVDEDRASRHWLAPFYYRDLKGNLLLSPVYQSGGREATGVQWRSVFPLYYQHETVDRRRWVTPLAAMTTHSDGRRNILTPVYARIHDKPGHYTDVIPPVLSWRQVTPDYTDNWLLMGLARWGGAKQELTTHVVPFYYHNPRKRMLLNPIYSRWVTEKGTEVRFSPPLLSWQRQEEAGRKDRRYALGLAGTSRDEAGALQKAHIIPLFSHDRERERFLSPVYQSGGREAAGVQWRSVFPLYYQHETVDRRLWVTPLAAMTTHSDGRGRILTPLYAKIHDKPGHHTDVIPSLLSWRHVTPDYTDKWLLMGLARWGGAKQELSTHVVPFYYHNPRKRMLLNPIYSRWVTEKGAEVRFSPPLLSWQRQDDSGQKDQRYALGLVGTSRDEAGVLQKTYVFPLFRHDREQERFFSPAYARWTGSDQRTYQAIPPLLSWRSKTSEGERRERILAGLYAQHTSSENERQYSHLLPFYSWQRNAHIFTPLYGRDAKEGGTFRYWMTPLVGSYRNEHAGFWMTPLVNWRKDRDTGYHDSSFLLWGRHETNENRHHTHWLPLFERLAFDHGPDRDSRRTYVQSHNQLSLLLIYNQQQRTLCHPEHRPVQFRGETYRQVTETTHRLFPLWSFTGKQYGPEGEGPSFSGGHVLWKLYDRKEEHGSEGQPHEYVRRRILWRVWHYERLNGDVSADSIPFITYDRTTDGFWRISFMWRVFRYEKDPESGRKLDLLLLPVRRGTR